MNFIQIIGAIELGLVFSLVTLGVFISFRVLNFPDLTVDGSFPLGASVCAFFITNGTHPVLATFYALLAGGLSGILTAWMSTRLKVLDLLAGILTMTALYSINIRIMGRPNLSLLNEETFFTTCLSWTCKFSESLLFPMAFILVCVLALLYVFFKTRLGLAIRATGSNPKMARANGISDHCMVWVGLSVSNAIIAFAGALFAQVQGFSDVSMGVGTIITGLAAIILGESLFPHRLLSQALFGCVVGTVFYRLFISFALNAGDFGLQASDLNLVTAILVGCAIFFSTVKKNKAA